MPTYPLKIRILTVELKNLTPKQQKFVIQYITNGNNASEAYRNSYDVSNMSADSINVEACKLLKNPKVTLWLEYCQQNVRQNFQEELIYTAQDALREYTELQAKSMVSSKTYNVAKGCIDGKCKVAGLHQDKVEHSVGDSLEELLDKLS